MQKKNLTRRFRQRHAHLVAWLQAVIGVHAPAVDRYALRSLYGGKLAVGHAHRAANEAANRPIPIRFRGNRR